MILTTGIAQKLEISYNLALFQMQDNFSAYTDPYILKKHDACFSFTFHWHIFNIRWSAWGKTFTHFLFKTFTQNCGRRYCSHQYYYAIPRGGTPDFKNQNPNKSLGLPTKPQKIPGPKINPWKIPWWISEP